jgi:Sulfotransferase family
MDERDDPIVIGGVGGSGTRAVAGVLQACGVQLAGSVTAALDSDFAIMLLRRLHWLPVLAGTRQARPDPELVQTFTLLRTMLAAGELDRPKLERLAAAAADAAALGFEQEDPAMPRWPPQKSFQLAAEYFTEPPQVKPGPFGWKYPGMFLFLPELMQAFPQARYIHVLRDPFDMAWSSNAGGVRLWAPLAGIDPSELETRPQNAQLAWWLYSTRLALSGGRGLRDRFMVVRLEQLVNHPRASARRLAAFAGLEPDAASLGTTLKAVQRPESIGRSAGQPLDVFDPKLLAEAQAYVTRWNTHGAEPGADDGDERTATENGAAEATSRPEPASDTAA